MSELLLTSPVVPDTEATDEMKEIDFQPALFAEEKHDSDSGNDLSSSSLDSQCSATISTDVPTIDILPTEVFNSTPKKECPPNVNTLDLSQSPADEGEVTASDRSNIQEEVKENGTSDRNKIQEEVKENGTSDRNNIQEEVKENGTVNSPETPQEESKPSEEKKTLEVELNKCIEEFRKIKIPVEFPNKKRNWQNDLLRKYQL
ncbi:BTB/POZ domain-containing protein KCTD16-like [Xenopus tropicalis]|nr:BTB/POZ domain-containing protein KCTD16-like [Xenopus tropicalis]